jgi:protein SCO1/2
MADLHDLESLSPIRFISFTTDPSHDSPEQLTTYMGANGIEGERWNFLTGESRQIEAISADLMLGLELSDNEDPSPDEIVHSSYLVLLGEDLSIVGHYDSSDAAAMSRLASDAESLATISD